MALRPYIYSVAQLFRSVWYIMADIPGQYLELFLDLVQIPSTAGFWHLVWLGEAKLPVLVKCLHWFHLHLDFHGVLFQVGEAEMIYKRSKMIFYFT